MVWQQGEHMLLVGATGSGKTTLAANLLSIRTYTLMLVTKPDQVKWPDWKTVHNVKSVGDHARYNRLRVNPPFPQQKACFRQLMEMVWNEGGWCIYVDETYYIEQVLGLRNELNQLLTQGRSKHISVVLGVQRPVWVSRFALSEPIHILSARMGDKRDINTMADSVSDEYAAELGNVKKYEFLYMNKVSGERFMVSKENVIERLKGM